MHTFRELVEWRLRGACPTHGDACRPKDEERALGGLAVNAAAQWRVDHSPLSPKSGW